MQKRLERLNDQEQAPLIRALSAKCNLVTLIAIIMFLPEQVTTCRLSQLVLLLYMAGILHYDEKCTVSSFGMYSAINENRGGPAFS